MDKTKDKTKKYDLRDMFFISDFNARETVGHLKQELSKKEPLRQQYEFRVKECFEINKGLKIVKSEKPDILVTEFKDDRIDNIEKFVLDVNSLADSYCPAIFVVLSSNPDPKERERIFAAGYSDILIKPFSIIEFVIKISIHIENESLKKNDNWRKAKLDKALNSLDMVEEKFASVKEELFDERDVLNNSLKQINLMTKERDKFKKEIEQADKELIGNLEGFTKLLCSMVESRIEKDRGHSFRVAEISLFVADEMKFSKKEKDQLGKAAMLHEVGKLLISESILNKNEEELSDNEKVFLKHYPVKGGNLLEMCSGFDEISDIVKYQNENMDGSGNPEGLKGKQIPLQSRILAGANLFDKLRCEEEISSLDDLFEKLEGNAGSRLDSKVVNYLEKYAVTRLGSDFEKVKGIGIHQLTTGMRLGTALFTSSGTKLFSANTLLDDASIEKIIKYNKEYPVDETIYIKA